MMTRLFAVALMLALGAGCANTSTLVTRHSAGPGEAPVRNLLLVGRSPELKFRSQWELACASRFSSADLRISTSHTLWPEPLPEQEALLQQARDKGFDGVLVGEITSLLLLPPQMPPDNVVSEERRASSDASPRTPGFQFTLGGGNEAPTDLPEDQDIEFQLQRSSGQVLWNGLIRTREANQIGAIARSQCERLHQALQGAGLIP